MKQNIIVETKEEIRFKYSTLRRIIIVMAIFIIVILGFFLLFIGEWFAALFGILLILIGLPSMLDIVFFKQLSFFDEYMVKEWFIFGRKEIKFSTLEASVAKRLWSGTIFFRDKNKKSFSQFFMNFETFPIGNIGFRMIRKILIDKKIIRGDENGWDY